MKWSALAIYTDEQLIAVYLNLKSKLQDGAILAHLEQPTVKALSMIQEHLGDRFDDCLSAVNDDSLALQNMAQMAMRNE